MVEYYAHSKTGNSDKFTWQLLEKHLRQTAELAREFATPCNARDWAYLAGLLHDLGKYTDEFQAYLCRSNGLDDFEYDSHNGRRINHSSAGTAYAEELLNRGDQPFGRNLAYVIAGHHAGLPDFHTCDGGLGALQKRLEDGYLHLSRIRERFKTINQSHKQPAGLPSRINKYNFHFWLRMLFSCLVDADYLDTEKFMNPSRAQYRSHDTSVEGLKHALDEHMASMISVCDKTPLNKARNEILEACRKAALCEPGLFSLTVPTGYGKTLSSITFALDHATYYKKKRIIYVIPFTSIIEQTAATLINIFGPDNVIEHHSNLNPDRETQRMRLASENWDAPIIVTTNVQFFESLYAARPSRCRKLHNIADSVVILDEAQLVPPNLLSPCVAVINELSSNYGVTILLSTATQPALPKLHHPREIIPGFGNYYKLHQRTHISFPQDLQARITWKQIARDLRKHKKVLCVVNSRRDCYDLYRLMPEGTIHLSALMCGEHRSSIIKTIKKRLMEKGILRVISTQLIEAGVDIDFPVVYRALAGLDSIVQAAGRCNREGMLPMGKVVVFVPPKPAPLGLLHKGENTTRELYSISGFDPQSPDLYKRYFELFYSKVTDTGEEFLKKLIPSDPKLLDVAFRTAGDEFRMIENQNARPVIVRYGENGRLINKLQKHGPDRHLLRAIQRYTVNISLYCAEKMEREGLIAEIWPGFYAQSQFNIYSEETGLEVFRGNFPIDDLIGI